MQGWLKLHRKIIYSEIFENEKMLKIFIYCLTKSSHKNTELRVGKQKVQLKPGQFIFGRKKAASELNMKESTVRDYLKILEEDGVITINPTNKYSVITVDNWAVYQSNDEEYDNKLPAENQQKDSNSSSGGQQKDTYKNERELKEVKNVKEFKTTTTSRQTNSEAIQFYHDNFDIIRPQISEEIISWSEDLGEKMVIEAMKRSLDRNKLSWGYVKSILRSWVEKEIKTLEQAQAEEIEHKSHVESKRNSLNKWSNNQEVVPEWFKSRGHEKPKSQPSLEDIAEQIQLGILMKKTSENIIETTGGGYDLTNKDIEAIRAGETTAEDILRSKTKLRVVGDP